MICTSWAWPNIFDVARSKVTLYSDTKSITNRVKLLMLSDPTELYMTPNFGVGLKRFQFQYKNENSIAMIKDALIAQLKLWEPSVIPEDTTVTQGLNYSQVNDGSVATENPNTLNLTVTLRTKYGQTLSFNVTDKDLGESL